TFNQIGLAFDPAQAAHLWVEQHQLAPPYKDTDTFLASVGVDYPLCLVSDADDDMILSHLQKYAFDAVFTSERFKSYKNSPGGELFRAVITHYSTRPEQIIHIGDGHSDIMGANQAGIAACWLNREGIKWNHDIKPDYAVESLDEAASILGIQT
ncbi:MAG: HAD family hydrolase, partial [Deltaproteobacteria bacterium]|nr:HAD family hydrolase [Deltaproteobacteria bacterium]